MKRLIIGFFDQPRDAWISVICNNNIHWKKPGLTNYSDIDKKTNIRIKKKTLKLEYFLQVTLKTHTICKIPTFTAVRRVISFPIRSTSTGRQAGNSALRLSPNVATTSPMQEIAHSLTSWELRNMRHGKKIQEETSIKNFTHLILILVRQTWHYGIVYWLNISFKIKTKTLHHQAIQKIRRWLNNVSKRKSE